MKQYIFILVLTSLIFGCKKEDANLNRNSFDPEQKILFQFEYINHAWGLQHNGWLMDSSGHVYTYNKPANWNFPDSAGLITEAALLENLSKAKLTLTVIDKNILKEKTGLINKAALGKLSEPHCGMADYGARVYSTFVYSKEEKKYKQILLNQYGDCSFENSAQEAKDLYQWLSSIKQN